MYILGSTQIDAIAMTNTILDYVDRCKLIDYNEIIKTDYHGFIVDIALEEYFGLQ